MSLPFTGCTNSATVQNILSIELENILQERWIFAKFALGEIKQLLRSVDSRHYKLVLHQLIHENQAPVEHPKKHVRDGS